MAKGYTALIMPLKRAELDRRLTPLRVHHRPIKACGGVCRKDVRVRHVLYAAGYRRQRAPD